MLKKTIKWMTNNLLLKLLAVMFAAILWLAVVNIDTKDFYNDGNSRKHRLPYGNRKILRDCQ